MELNEPSPSEAKRARDARAARNAAKLAAIARDKWNEDPTGTTSVGTGAALLSGTRAAVLLEGEHGLGAAISWADRSGATELHVVSDDNSGVVARQAAEFSIQSFTQPIQVWRSEGRDLIAAEIEAPHDHGGPPDAPDLVALLEGEGLDVVVEGDRLSGEFRGLEIVRIVRAVDNGEPILEVGVGRFDRHMTGLMHGEMDGRDSIKRVVEQLREIRRPDGPFHPLKNLVPERWLRSTAIADPSIVGCDSLEAAPASIPRDRLKMRGVAAARGKRAGEDVIVVFSVGVDLEGPILAADTRASLNPDAPLLYALPKSDVLGATGRLVDGIATPAEVVPVVVDWKR